ncbi:alpha/beta-hydrolase [Macroventuria anomochaeta]|uniref:Alpha/beta-hydrolase n=1 Tax=Macroventuria anomochaeta TaxID=301207 RepID=A0ACB6RQT4_9PLEO|nr:alpha/beta-hydrolase [Macroventuria anomochaeta]KAF2624266.1 alpha/beta-hydrolase [Macroventuria anomochaeta]
MSAPGTSLSSSSRPSTPSKPARLEHYLGLSHAPHSNKPCIVKPMSITVEDGPDGAVPGFLHLPPTASATPASNTAAILLSGAGGGIVGPSSIYLSLADKLASLKQPVPALRLDYRYPARNKYCVRDVLSAMDELEGSYGIKSFVLVGWSFGGAPVFTVGGSDKRTAETEGIRTLSPKPLLLLHGTGDRTLSKSCSESLYERYGTKGDRYLHLFPNDDHALTRNSLEAEQLIGGFILKCAGIKAGRADDGVLAEKLVKDDEKVELMEKGGDLRRNESVE